MPTTTAHSGGSEKGAWVKGVLNWAGRGGGHEVTVCSTYHVDGRKKRAERVVTVVEAVWWRW